MMKNLQTLLSDIQNQIVSIHGNAETEIKGITADSRQAGEGFLFIALKGVQVDGKSYIEQAIEKGVTAILYEGNYNENNVNITWIHVQDSAETLGHIASAWYGHPSHHLKLVGVTGTNGKTTTATLLYNLFQELGYVTGLISTVCNYVGKTVHATTHTTPDPVTINQLLAQMMDAGCDYVFMEVSSHAVHQRRTAGLVFTGGVFTNLSQDHLDYHKTMQEYLKVKKMFFDNLPSQSFALTNADDKNGSVMLQNTKAERHTYAVKTLGDFKACIIEKHFDGTIIQINDQELEVPFVGTFNVYNILAVYGAAVLLKQKPEEILVILSKLKPVAGRFQTIRSRDGVTAIVDYAHTPDALTNVLEAIHGVLEGSGKVITVIGCGGNRDKTKRPLMAQEAVKLSDQVILTSDNPRFEDPQAIIDDMIEGLDLVQLKKTFSIAQRDQAIKTACALAQPGDVVLIAGKGHEDYQDVRGVKHHFDDKDQVESIFGLTSENKK